jgi:hypothetical protein
MDALKKLLHTALVLTLLIGLWQGYGRWLISRWWP